MTVDEGTDSGGGSTAAGGRLSRLRNRVEAGIRGRLERLRWWYALRFGGAPRCAVCGDEAAWIAVTEDEPRCFKHIPGEGMEAIRDVEPADCFVDWGEPGDDA